MGHQIPKYSGNSISGTTIDPIQDARLVEIVIGLSCEGEGGGGGGER